MRPRISIRRSVRPSVVQSVLPSVCPLLIVVISIVDRFDGCLMNVIQPFFFYTKMFLHSIITFLDIVVNFMKIDAISGSFYAAVTLQLPIKGQRLIL